MIKAIETVYPYPNGDRFRSRLEARWAVFFRTLGLKYKYEHEGYDIDGAWYLPDFWLPDLGYCIEIKPCTSDLDDWPDHIVFDYMDKKMNSNQDIDFPFEFYLIVGDPWLDDYSEIHEYSAHGLKLYFAGNSFEYNCFPFGDSYYYWCECPQCHKIGLSFEGRAARLCNCFKQKMRNTATPRLINAYRAARQARFEHGETPS